MSEETPSTAGGPRSSALAHLKSLRQAQLSGRTSDGQSLPVPASSALPSTSAPVTNVSALPAPEPPARSSAAASAPGDRPSDAGAATLSKWVITWECRHCRAECIPVRSESRCLCGHRLREHGDLAGGQPPRCKNPKCKCAGFFYLFAEGSFILRCKCKHKGVEHDPSTRRCAKAGCSGCEGFSSPWVCNCNHPWAEHDQKAVLKEVPRFLSAAALMDEVRELEPRVLRGED